MSKSDRQKKRALRKRQGPSAPRVIGANDNTPRAANDNLPPIVVGGITLSPKQASTYRKALDDLASDDLARKREGGQAMRELEAELNATHDAKHMESVKAEIAALERGRGGALRVEKARDRRGEDGEQLRVSRDGLETLLTAKSITRVEHAAGLRYRSDYETIDPEKALMPPTLDMTSKKVIRGGDHWADKRREIEQRVFRVHLMICGIELADGQNRALPRLPAGHAFMRRIHALNMVAGKGKNLSEITSSGSASARMSADLKSALQTAAIVYGLV